MKLVKNNDNITDQFPDANELLCAKCKKWSCRDLWLDVDVFCETCGEHSAVRCSECWAVFESTEYSKIEGRVV